MDKSHTLHQNSFLPVINITFTNHVACMHPQLEFEIFYACYICSRNVTKATLQQEKNSGIVQELPNT